MIDGEVLMFGDVMQEVHPGHGWPEQQQVLAAGAQASTAGTGASDGLIVGNACGESGPRGCALTFHGARATNAPDPLVDTSSAVAS